MSSRSHLSRPLLAILSAYLLLGIVYAWATPPLEASDEFKHYPVVQYIQTTGKLPVLDPQAPGLWRQEAAQPPLYYLAMAAATSWIDTSDLPDVHQANPHAFIGNPNQIGNKNLIVHGPEEAAFPGTGSIQAIRLIRLISLLLGALTVYITAQLGFFLFNRGVGLLAAALTAFNPMFLFVNAAVNNDSLAILLGTLGIYLLVRWWCRPPASRRWWHYALLGAVSGLGALTKLSLLGLLGMALLVLALQAWRERAWSQFLAGGALLVAPVLAICGWWLLRNVTLYGDLTALNAFVAVQGVRDVPMTWADWRGEFGTFYRSFWGLFGAVNVAAPQWLYTVYNLGALLGAVGLVAWVWRHRKGLPAGLWLLPLWALVVFLLLLRWNLISPAFQGRLLFPALGALNVLWAAGLLAWVRERWQPALVTAVTLLMLAAAATLPWTTIRPAYAAPDPLAAVPAQYRFGPITFQEAAGDAQVSPPVALVGVDVPPGQRVSLAGEPVVVTLYWQALAPTDQDYVSSVHLLGPELASLGQVDRYPGSGLVPTSRWQPGQIWRDSYHVYPDTATASPLRLRISADLYDATTDASLDASGPDGQPMAVVIVGDAWLDAFRPAPMEPAHLLTVPFADGIEFVGYDQAPQPARPGDTLDATLYWRATGTPGLDYTVFVHLLDGQGNQVAGGDAQPVAANSPTSGWRAGDEIADPHAVLLPPDLSPGTYRLAVGLYDPASGARLPRLDGSGDSVSWDVKVESP